MTAYYNEIDHYAAQWLRNLIKSGHIAPGYVDERSIIDVKPEDLTEFTQCHFFAGIGVWSLALRNAGWSDDRPVWTGSCPCQPFSVAGKKLGKLDERHLAPVWLNLIQQQNPPVIFGEQVAGAISKHWIDDLFTELENESYTCGAAVLPACGVGAPHKRERLFFGCMGNPNSIGRQSQSQNKVVNGKGMEQDRREQVVRIQTSSYANRFWENNEYIECLDGRFRPVEPGTFPLAHGATQRVGRLRAYGNCIVPQAATEFIIAFEGANS